MKKNVNMCYQFLVIILSTPALIHAQSPGILWTKVYGGSASDIAYSVQPTNDNGFVAVGVTHSFGIGNGDIWLVKLDSLGDTVWTHTYGGTGNDVGNSVDITTDGGYVIAGWTDSSGTGDYDLYLLRTDEEGTMLWTNTYGGPRADVGYSVEETSDGGYIAVGKTNHLGTSDVYLVKVDSLGNLLWTRMHGGSQDEWGRCVQENYHGGFVIAGYKDENAFLLVTDANGDTSWTQTYGGPNTDNFFSVQQTYDSGYIAVGATGSFTGPDYDVYVVRTNEYGDTLWTRTYGSSADHDYGFSICATYNGYIITGFYAWSPMFYTCNLYLLRIDNNGDELWSMTVTYGSECHGESVQLTADGGYVVAGWTSPYPPYDCDFLILRTEQDTCYTQEQRNYGVNNLSLRIYPNPFQNETDIRYEIRDVGLELLYISLQIYDAAGRLVRDFRLITSEGRGPSSQGNGASDASRNTLSWDGRDDRNLLLHSGVYFVTLRAGDFTATEKLLLIR